MVKEVFKGRNYMPMSEWNECGEKWQIQQENILDELKESNKPKKLNKKKKKCKKDKNMEDNTNNSFKKGLKFYKYGENGEPI